MHLVQIEHPEHGRRAAIVDGATLHLLHAHRTIFALANTALERQIGIDTAAHGDRGPDRLNYDDVYNGSTAWRLLPPFDHPDEPARCLVTGTGLTHKASAENRARMH